MFCSQFPLMPYAKYTKNCVLFFGIVKPGTKRLENCVFSFQIVSLKKDNQDHADTVLECFRFFRLWIFPHLCVLFLRFEHPIQFAEKKEEDIPIVDKEDGSSVDKGVEQDRLR